MQIKYEVAARGNEVVEEQKFQNICCDDMKKALLAQETPLVNARAVLWLYCPFCKTEIEY